MFEFANSFDIQHDCRSLIGLRSSGSRMNDDEHFLQNLLSEMMSDIYDYDTDEYILICMSHHYPGRQENAVLTRLNKTHINRVEKFDFVPTPRKIHHSKELEKLNKMIQFSRRALRENWIILFSFSSSFE